MIIRKIAIIGGTGFVGKTLANRLSREGYSLKVLTRNREENRTDLILIPELDLIQTNVHDPGELSLHLKGCDAVINLVGILNERGRKGLGFRSVHVELTKKIIEACQENGIHRLIQMSALNADQENGTSYYLRTKGEAENLVHNINNIHVTSFRPSVIFGEHDSFFNRFAFLLKLTPLFFPLACANTRFAPVFVEDVAEAFVLSLKNPLCYGKRYDLCGPHDYSLKELVEYTANCIGVKRYVIPLSDILSRIQAAIFDFVPGKPFSTDNYLSAKVDSTCKQNHLVNFNIEPQAIEGIVPQYLSNQVQRARYFEFRQHSRRQI